MRLRRTIVVLMMLVLLSALGGCPRRAGVEDLRRFAMRAAYRGLWSEARLRWEQALELAPGDPGLLNNLAVAHEALGNYEEARRLYERAVEYAPGSDDIRENLLDFSRYHRRRVEGVEDVDKDKASPVDVKPEDQTSGGTDESD